MRRSLGRRFTPSWASNSTSEPSTIRPLSGRNRPARAAKIVLLPEPEGPNRTFKPGPKASAASSEKRGSLTLRCNWSRALSVASEAIAPLPREVTCTDQHHHGEPGHGQRQAQGVVVETCEHGVINREGRGAGLAGNVPGDHQRDPEVPERAGKAEQNAGHDAASSKRQANTQKG